MKTCAICGGSVDDTELTCSKCGRGVFNTEKKYRIGDTEIDNTKEGNINISDYRLVMALSQAIQQKFKNYPPEMAAAIFIAMTEKNRNDLVEKPEGIFISRKCWEKLLSYDIWLAADGQIIITRKGLGGRLEEPKADSQQFLQKHLPSARRLGRMNSYHYAIGLALTFGLDQNSIILNSNRNEVAIYY